MIDFNEQQPLNNLLEVLGEKFFIINDLEHNSKVYFIQLVREADRWQFYILKAEKETNLKFK
jgi:hypothetical protein